jgi:hypothetical protein
MIPRCKSTHVSASGNTYRCELDSGHTGSHRRWRGPYIADMVWHNTYRTPDFPPFSAGTATVDGALNETSVPLNKEELKILSYYLTAHDDTDEVESELVEKIDAALKKLL